MTRVPAALAIVASLTLLSTATSVARPPDDCDLLSGIGGATMLQDGTIYLDLVYIAP